MGQLPKTAKDAASTCARDNDVATARLQDRSLCLHHVEQRSSRTASSKSAAAMELTQQAEVSGHMSCSFELGQSNKNRHHFASLAVLLRRIRETDTITKIVTVRMVV